MDRRKSPQAGWERGLPRIEKLGKWVSGLGAKAAARTEHFWASLASHPWHVTLETQASGGEGIATVEGGRYRGDQYTPNTEYAPGMKSAGYPIIIPTGQGRKLRLGDTSYWL